MRLAAMLVRGAMRGAAGTKRLQKRRRSTHNARHYFLKIFSIICLFMNLSHLTAGRLEGGRHECRAAVAGRLGRRQARRRLLEAAQARGTHPCAVTHPIAEPSSRRLVLPRSSVRVMSQPIALLLGALGLSSGGGLGLALSITSIRLLRHSLLRHGLRASDMGCDARACLGEAHRCDHHASLGTNTGLRQRRMCALCVPLLACGM